MSYYTGSAANLTAVLTALTTACETEGWTWSGGILSKADPGIYVRFDATTALGSYTPLRMWGQTALSTNETQSYVCCALPIRSVEVTYPVIYHIFVFSSEVFMVINYSDKFQWLAFGQSDQPGLDSTGNWISATCGFLHYTYNIWRYPDQGINMTNPPSSQSYGDKTVCPGLGWTGYGYWPYTSGGSMKGMQVNTWVATGLDPTEDADFTPWTCSVYNSSGGNQNITGINYNSELFLTQPNAFNNEGILLPIKVIKKRPSSKFSQILQVQNARHIRVDNYASTEVISLGTDQWMIFPWYCKNTTTRNGGTNIAHTGTFGWAIKYEPVT